LKEVEELSSPGLRFQAAVAALAKQPTVRLSLLPALCGLDLSRL